MKTRYSTKVKEGKKHMPASRLSVVEWRNFYETEEGEVVCQKCREKGTEYSAVEDSTLLYCDKCGYSNDDCED